MHIACHVGVGVEREARIGVSEDTCQGLGIDTALGCLCGEGVSQVMEADQRKLKIFEYCLELSIG